MSILVVNCFHWVGFHIVNGFLEKGEDVDGIDLSPSDETEHLASFFGRNSLFQQVEANTRKEYDTTIMIGDVGCFDTSNSKQVIRINDNNGLEEGNCSFVTNIRVELLFGEWMPMNRQGVYKNSKHISFDSEQFLTQAVYIQDFVEALFNWVTIRNLPRSLMIKSKNHKLDINEKLENTIYLKDNTPIEEKIQTVITHYDRFKKFYSL